MRGRKGLAALLAALVLLSTATAGVAALNFTDGEAPNPRISADVTVDAFETSWGDDLKYEDDSGAVTDLPATVNRSDDVDDLGNGHVNPYTFMTDVEFEDAGAFPHDSNDSALHADEWTTSGAAVSNVTTAPGVDAVEFDASADGDSMTYETDISSNAEKKQLQMFYDVSDASGASEVTVTIHDATDGDTAEVKLYDDDGNTSDIDVGATETGEGKAIQVQVGELDASGGDNSIEEIGKIVVSADGAANVDFSAINLDKTSKYDLGEKYVQTTTTTSSRPRPSTRRRVRSRFTPWRRWATPSVTPPSTA